MEALIGLLRETSAALPLLQVFIGGAVLMLIAYMVIKGMGDRHAATPAPAAGSLSDVPPIFAQGPQATLDALREIKDQGRRLNELVVRIDESAREIAAHAREQTGILRDIANEQEIANRANGRRRGDER